MATGAPPLFKLGLQKMEYNGKLHAHKLADPKVDFRMRTLAVCSLPLLLLGCHVFAQSSLGSKICSDGNIVFESALLAELEPRVPAVPATCSASANSLLQSFKREDEANWEALSNRACAAKEGWVENIPGTCQAGGPPPICKANHWHKDPQAAQASFKDYEQNQILAQRQQQVTNAACACWLNLAQQSPNAQTLARNSNPYSYTPSGPNPYTSSAVIPCSGSQECSIAEPGSVCSSKHVCEFPNALQASIAVGMQKTVSKTDSVAQHLVRDEAVETILAALPSDITALITGVGSKLVANPAFSASLSLLNPTEVSTNIDGYKAALQKLASTSMHLQEQYRDLKRFDAGLAPARVAYSRDELLAEMEKTKADMKNQMDLANQFLAGAEQEREFPQGACTNVVDFQNSAVMAHIASLMNPNLQ